MTHVAPRRDSKIARSARLRSTGAPASRAGRLLRSAAAVSLLGAAVVPAQAEVVGFEVLDVQNPALEGRAFGDSGTLVEKITGKATIAVDPSDPRNAVIADIALAPRNADGLVEAVVDVEILRPLNGGNGTILLESPNAAAS